MPIGVTVSGLGLIACTYGLARYAYGLFLPVFREQFALSGALSGAIATGGYASYCCAALLAQRLLGRDHARGAAGLAGVLAALGCTAIAAAPSAGVLAAGVLVAGSGAGLASPAMVALIVPAVMTPGRPRAKAIVNAGTGAGVLVSGPVALLLAHQWRLAWTTATLFTVLTLGQAIGATLIGVLTDVTNPLVAFTAAAVLAATSAIPTLHPPGGPPAPTTASHPTDSRMQPTLNTAAQSAGLLNLHR